MGAIFDDHQAVSGSEVTEGIHLARTTGEVNRQEGACSWSDLLLHLCGIHVHCDRIDVCKNGCCPGVNNRIRRRAKSQRCRNDLIARVQVSGEKTEVEGGSTGIHGNGVFSPFVSCEVSLKLRDFRAGPEPTAPHARYNFLDLLFLNGRGAENDKWSFVF
jgi:hypothetical protein